MASLFTNASAQTALKTLTAASKSLASTQTRVATGYRINTAEDNAAYWSIATTLRSDVNALGAVKDALGLGAATVDTVYTGISDTKDLLDQVKSKLVAASQSGVPKAQVQAEITQLQNRLKDTSKSTVINSESWLTQDTSVAGYTSQKDVVGSFTRAAGVVTIENITIDITKTKLYENSTSAQDAVTASLDSATATTARGVYAKAMDDIKAVTNATNAAWNNSLKKTYNPATTTSIAGVATPAAGRTSFGAAATTGTDFGTAVTAISTALTEAQLNTALGLGPTADFGGAGGAGSKFLSSLSADDKTALLNELNANATALKTTLTDINNGAVGDAVGAERVAAATAALATYDAAVAESVNKYVGVAARDAFVTKTAENAIATYSASAKGDVNNQQLGIFDKVRSVISDNNGGNAKAVRVSDIDISNLSDTGFDKAVLSSYISAVDDALQELTLSASIVGAAKARIEGNKTFVQNLVDANNRGIGQLVDADLNEESTKLKALQVQEQLAVQALGIANSSTQSILSLFQ
ncbi:flagellin [Pseudochelatococcus contaminans]|uniref:Flagellin n=1 Tax=Pseudochelatococcus contaminans TaxID=1538103 RepID=A0A7W6EI21_9HYPH|nr:flagellin [Pseudochelatococcus contaminans]MBB3810709.1 flagellin [Pseudochelatococcus contaminans]